MLELCQRASGMTVLPGRVVAPALARGELAYHSLNRELVIRRPAVSIRRQGAYQNQAATTLLDQMSRLFSATLERRDPK